MIVLLPVEYHGSFLYCVLNSFTLFHKTGDAIDGKAHHYLTRAAGRSGTHVDVCWAL